ncbi:c-type cytochrome [Hyphomicrobium sp. B1]|jgi:cytochrome c553|uniref:c-type cytochrome n=1 Tax=unclassified Hyphomicrobium TaxID=2619925 RepID=UPI00391C1513
MALIKQRAVFSYIVAACAIVQTASYAQAADLAAGRKRAEVCMACHGEKGISEIPGIPSLAGQDTDYIVSALKAYRAGTERTNPTMAEMAKPLSDADIDNLAAFWHSLASPLAQK